MRNAVIEDFLEKVKAHPADVQSLEVKSMCSIIQYNFKQALNKSLVFFILQN